MISLFITDIYYIREIFINFSYIMLKSVNADKLSELKVFDFGTAPYCLLIYYWEIVIMEKFK